MTTAERLAICQALAEEAERTARALQVLASELAEIRDDAREALGLSPIRDERQEKML